MALTKAELRAQLIAPVAKGGRPRLDGANLSLLPTLTGTQYSDSYKRTGMEYAIASIPEVKRYIEAEARTALAKAQGHLGVIRAAAAVFGEWDHWVRITLEHKDNIDWYLVLTDTKTGHKGALSIEYGRNAYQRERSDGTLVTIGAMTGKFILHKAFGIRPNGLQGTGGGTF